MKELVPNDIKWVVVHFLTLWKAWNLVTDG